VVERRLASGRSLLPGQLQLQRSARPSARALSMWLAPPSPKVGSRCLAFFGRVSAATGRIPLPHCLDCSWW
jgi:hypothetical protein